MALLITVLICALSSGVSAQIIHGMDNKVGKVDLGIPLDSSRYELIYELRTYDPINQDSRENIRIMQIGDSCRGDEPYGNFRVDSVFWVIHEPQMRWNDANHIFTGYGNVRGGRSGPIYNFDGNRWRDVEFVTLGPGGQACAYDSTAVQNWELLEGEMEILGFKCRQARCTFRGRDWTAWYAPEIAVDGGPWKLRGLPGLILSAYSSDKEYAMDAVAVRNGSGIILMKPSKCTVMTRKAMTEKLKENREYPWRNVEPGGYGSVISGSPIDKNKRAFFNPIEKSLD